MPILLRSDAMEHIATDLSRYRAESLRPRGSARALFRGLPGATLNSGNVRALVLNEPGAILDVGSGMRRLTGSTVNVDLAMHELVDVVADAATLPFADESFNLVVCQGVLEHVPEPREVMRQIRRVTKCGGRVFVEVPFLQPFHADPGDYQRFTLLGLKHLCRDFEIESAGVSAGAFSALAFGVREFPEQFFRGKRSALRIVAKIPFAILGSIIRYGDLLLRRAPSGHRLAASVFVVGRRSCAS